MRAVSQFGRYSLIEKIANGGTAEVWRARLEGAGGFAKTVAVKRLLPAWCANDELQAMLVDEARVVARLQHQNIVSVLDMGLVDGVPFIAMEYVDGIDCARLLRALLHDGEPLPMPILLAIAEQVLVALTFAHRCADEAGRPLGIVHRDISPSNILLSRNGEVKVTDFGIAKGAHRSQATAVGQLRGKYAYMAPEQAAGQPIDHRADLFAAGVVLFELACARRLFQAESECATLARVREAALPVDDLQALPAPLRAVLLLSLAREPEKRYESAEAMLAAVRVAARQLGAEASPLEIAAYLHERFPPEPGIAPADPIEATRATRVLLDGVRRSRARIPAIARAAGIAFLIALLLPIPASQGRRPAAARRVPAVQAAVSEAPLPAARGVVAIDSIPSGQRAVVTIGDARHEGTTPMTVDDIAIADAVEGRVTIRADGYRALEHAFTLTDANPAFVRRIALVRRDPAQLSVQARPWGIVTVPGHLSRREAPVTLARLEPGAYTVTVLHPPTGRRVSRSVQLVGGAHARCQAAFAGDATLTCR